MDLAQRLRLWADELQAIASEGLHWSGHDPYDTHRYHRVRRIAAEIFAEQDTRSPATVEQQFAGDLARWSPYPTGDAAIFNEAGEILLIQRKDDQLWAMPGGAFEVGETPAEGTCREAWEETGVAAVPVALIGVYDSRYVGSRTIHARPRIINAAAVPKISCSAMDDDTWCIVSAATGSTLEHAPLQMLVVMVEDLLEVSNYERQRLVGHISFRYVQTPLGDAPERSTLHCMPKYILPTTDWAILLKPIVRDAPAGSIIEMHTTAMYDLVQRELREAGRTDIIVRLQSEAVQAKPSSSQEKR